MIMKKSITTLALATTLLAAGSAFADATPTNTSSTKAKNGILDRISASYTNVFYGPSVGTWDMKHMPDYTTGDAVMGQPLMSKNYLSLGYKVNNNLSLSGTFYTYSYYADSLSPAGVVTRHAGVRLADSYVKATIPKAYHQGNFNLAVQALITAPLSDNSKATSRITFAAAKQLFSYEVPKSKMTLSLETYEEAHLYSNRHKAASVNGTYDLDFYTGPTVAYQLSPTVSVSALYEFETHRKVGAHGMDFDTNYMDIEPGVSWDITPRINLNPFLNLPVYTEGQTTNLNLKTTQICAVLALKLL
jgi:hypothetical protein